MVVMDEDEIAGDDEVKFGFQETSQRPSLPQTALVNFSA